VLARHVVIASGADYHRLPGENADRFEAPASTTPPHISKRSRRPGKTSSPSSAAVTQPDRQV